MTPGTVTATRVGATALPLGGKHRRVPCPRCGRRRQLRDGQPVDLLCRDCKSVDPTFGQEVAS
jgi:PHP family Zn ribbon phosphoesterase